jgi:hypothetical protein
MQVATDRRISDEESVKLGSRKLVDAYHSALATGNEKAKAKSLAFDPAKNQQHRLYIVSNVAATYNRDDNYVSEIRELHASIVREFYPEFNPPPPPRFSDYYI